MAEALIDPAAIDEESVIRTRGGIGRLVVDHSLVVVDEEVGRAHALNPTGSVVWECLDGSAPLRDLIDDLATGFAAPRDTVATDVVNLVRSLGALGLLEGVGMAISAMPVDLELVSADECPPDGDPAAAEPTWDSRYLKVPPNG